jgi:serine/threonine protein kinase
MDEVYLREAPLAGADRMERTVTNPPGYEILGELGRGGMGIVYKAQDLKHDRLVALKMILSGRGAVILELARFRIEVEAIASLAHPNIVLIHEVGVHLGYPYFALEFAGGGSLAKKIRGQPMPCDWTAQVTLKLALAMQHAHERAIIHRDLKPSNVLMMTDDIPKIADFGLAKFTTAKGYRNAIESQMTIEIPEAFQQLTQLRKEFRRSEGYPNEDVSRAIAELERALKQRTDTPHTGDGRLDENPEFIREALRKQLQEDAADDLSPAFQDYVIRSEWRRKAGSPNMEDERLLEDIRRFIRDGLLQATCDLPGDSKAHARLTESGAIMGTPQYMAPEQAWGRNDEVGPSADIYSLGAILYEMLTGQPPFTGDPLQVIMKARSRPPVPPRRRRDSVDPALEAICLKCLEQTADQRYESMATLAQDLRRFIDNVEVHALQVAPPTSQRLDPTIDPNDGGETKTWVPDGTTEPVPAKIKSWWQFWR